MPWIREKASVEGYFKGEEQYRLYLHDLDYEEVKPDVIQLIQHGQNPQMGRRGAVRFWTLPITPETTSLIEAGRQLSEPNELQ